MTQTPAPITAEQVAQLAIVHDALTQYRLHSTPEHAAALIQTILAIAPTPPCQPRLAVWYGPMPESNGKSNWTALLHREGVSLLDGPNITLDRSEYPDRVRYEADRVRHLIGELENEPCILDYDTDKCDVPPTHEP